MEHKCENVGAGLVSPGKGITLIALVITVIILIILAAITINLTVGDSGIITRAEEAAFKTEASAMMEEYDLYIANKSIDGNYEVESLTAEENSLMYGGERLEGNIQTILPGLNETSKKDYEIIKGELYYKSQDVRKLKWALEIGMKVNPFIIIDGVLISTDVNLGLLDNTGVITVPATVTKIDKGTFNNLAGIKKVIIPGTVKEIADNAFSNNTTIEEVIIEDGVERVGDYAFYGCSALKEIVFPDSVSYIGSWGLAHCSKLEKVKLSNNIDVIKDRLCTADIKLKEIVIPEKVTTIQAYSFSGCSDLETINIPKAVNNIEGSVFTNTLNLHHIDVAEENQNYKFEKGMLLSKDEKILYFALLSLTNLEMPNTITYIRGEAFSGSNIERLKLSDNITSLTGASFNWMKKLQEIVTSENNANYIANDKALYNKNKTSLIKYFGKDTTITVPEGIKRITTCAIENGITTKINLPSSLEIVDYFAFRYVTKLTHIEIPEKVKEIGYGLLPQNATVTINEKNPYMKSVDNMILSKDETILYMASGAVENFNVPNTVKIIKNRAFYNNTKVEAIILPTSIKDMEQRAFYACTNLKKITIPNTIETIASNVFERCNNLTEIIITNIDPNKKEGSIEGSPWGCPYGARAVKWEK